MAKDVYDTSKKGLAIASLITGIIGILISFTPVGIVFAILAIIFSGICIDKKHGVKGIVIAGLILGMVGLCAWMILFLTGGTKLFFGFSLVNTE